jgi:hypothetical protein
MRLKGDQTQMPKKPDRIPTRWDKKLFDEKGKPKKGLPPETWFQWIVLQVKNRSQLAQLLGVSTQAIYGSSAQKGWTRIPTRFVLKIESEFGIPRQMLAPDIYPE